MIDPTADVHPQAITHCGVTLGACVKIWPFASVIRRSIVGAGGSVGSCAIVDGSRVGPDARIGHGAQLHPGVVAGRKLFVGPGAILCNDLWPWLDGQAFDIDALIQGRQVTVICGDHVTIGAGAIVLPGVRLGTGCAIAAGAVVEADVPAGCLLRRDGQWQPNFDGAKPQRMRVCA